MGCCDEEESRNIPIFPRGLNIPFPGTWPSSCGENCPECSQWVTSCTAWEYTFCPTTDHLAGPWTPWSQDIPHEMSCLSTPMCWLKFKENGTFTFRESALFATLYTCWDRFCWSAIRSREPQSAYIVRLHLYMCLFTYGSSGTHKWSVNQCVLLDFQPYDQMKEGTL